MTGPLFAASRSPPPQGLLAPGLLLAFLLSILAVQVAVKKLAVVSLGSYPVFVAQLSAVANVAVNGTALLWRLTRGAPVPSRQLRSLPHRRFALVGLVDACVQSVGYTVAFYLPGPFIPVLGQAQLLWLFVFARAFFGRSFSAVQYAGGALVATGVVLSVASPSPLGGHITWTHAIMLAAVAQAGLYAPLASLSATTKEALFSDGKRRFPKDGGLDVGLARALETL